MLCQTILEPSAMERSGVKGTLEKSLILLLMVSLKRHIATSLSNHHQTKNLIYKIPCEYDKFNIEETS